jgi:hypothetical protein
MFMSKRKALALGLGIPLLLALVIIFIISGQGNEEPTPYEGPPLNTTRVTVQPEDTVKELSTPLPQDPILADLIVHSDTIVIGTVTDILPAKRCTVKFVPIIYTDVIVEAERYLYGEPQSERVGIQCWGGRIGNEVMIVENEAFFNLGENVVVFLFRIPYKATPPYGIEKLSYYTVCGACLGKFTHQEDGLVDNGWLEDFPGQVLAISTLENQIAEIKGGDW